MRKIVKLYEDGDLWDAVMQRRKIFAVFAAVTAVCLGGIVTCIALYADLPYGDGNGAWMIAVSCVLAAIYVAFCFPYMGICFKRSNAYCKMLKFISCGLKECTAAPFAGVEDWTVHDGVDVNVAAFEIDSVKRDETMIRHIYIDGEKDYPPFEEGKKIKFVTQGNLLIAYEAAEEAEQLPPI